MSTRVQGILCTFTQGASLRKVTSTALISVLLIELLTRKKPFSYLSTEDDGLVSHFVKLLAEGRNLVQIIDPQVTDEEGEKVKEVDALAASCVNIRGEGRSVMR